MKNFKALVKMVNREIERVVAMLQDNIDCFATRNLKLYDIAWNDTLQEEFNLTDEQYFQMFNWFCEDSYRFFLEWMHEEGIDEGTIQYIGRTSSFNLIPVDGLVELDRYDNVDFENSMNEYIWNNVGQCTNLECVMDDSGRVSLEKIRRFLSSLGNEFYCLTVEEASYDLKRDLELIAENIFTDYEYSIEDAMKIHSYLKDFQDNQVEIFREFLNDYVDEYIA